MHALKIYGGVEVKVHLFLTLALDGTELSDWCPANFTSGKIFRCRLNRICERHGRSGY